MKKFLNFIKNTKYKNIIILSLLLALYVFISAHSYVSAVSNNLSDAVFRLHVIANSDSNEDQSLKLKVRDALLNYMNNLCADCSTKQEAISIANEHKEDFQKIAENTIEVGRSCVSPEHRDGTVVALLWGGIAEIVYRSRLRYMFGCVSLEDTNPASGWAIYEHLKTMGKISDQIFAEGLPKCVMPRPPQEEIDAILNDRKLLRGLIPPLFKGYLRLGAKICGEPVFDHEFGTIDFLILLDVSGLPERYIKHFNVASVG